MPPSATAKPDRTTVAPRRDPPPANADADKRDFPVLVLGTPHAAWRDLAEALLAPDPRVRAAPLRPWLDAALGADPGAWDERSRRLTEHPLPSGVARSATLDERALWAVEHLSSHWPQVRLLVFVDRPERALAHWISCGAEGTPAQALEAWCRGAQRILHTAHGHPQRVLLIDSDEAAAHLNALKALLARRLGLSASDAVAAPVGDALAAALASGWIPVHSTARRLFDELRATCLPLVDEPLTHDVAEIGHEAQDAAVRHLRDLRREASQARALVAELSPVREALTEAESRVAELRQQLSQAQGEAAEHAVRIRGLEAELSMALANDAGHLSEVRRLETDLSLARAQTVEHAQAAELLQQQLVQLEAALRESAAADRRGAEQLAVQSAAVKRLQSELAAARAALEAATRAGQAHRETAERASAQKAKTAEALRVSREEGKLLVEQLLQVQGELKRRFAELKRIEHVAHASGTSIRADSVKFGRVADKPPHRHLDIELVGLRSGSRNLPRASARLAEHHGRPGLVLLTTVGQPTPLASWHPNGKEGERALLTLVPSDDTGRGLLERMGTADWLTVTGLVALLEHELARKPFADAARWLAVARRLQTQLSALPPRLRYDGVRRRPADDAQDGSALVIDLEGALYGQRTLGPVELRWNRSGGSGVPALQWLLPRHEGMAPALASWPTDEDGAPQPQMALPVGPGLSDAEKRRGWARFSDAERDLIMGLLDALPACATPERADAAGADGAALARAAQALATDARRSLRSLRLRALLRRAMRRQSAGDR